MKQSSYGNLLCGTVLCAVGLLAGCGSSGGGSQDGSGGMVNCDPFNNVGAVVTPTSDPGAPAAMSGGTVVEGTYALTAWVQYNGTTTSTPRQETFVFAGGTIKHTELKNAAQQVLAGTYSTSGTTITFAITCPQAMSIPLQYTATATSFAFVPPDDADRVQSYTLQ